MALAKAGRSRNHRAGALRGSDPSLCPVPMLQRLSYVHYANLYIRNIIPDDMSIPLRRLLALRGGAMRYSPECVE